MDPKLAAHYTPAELAHAHVLAALRVFNTQTRPDHERAEVIDLACGDGALLQAACDLGVAPERCTGMDLDPVAVEAATARNADWTIQLGDALFDLHPFEDTFPYDRYDIALCNPPWIGKVSGTLGRDYAKRVAKRYGPDYNAASDICAAFILRAAEIANQLSFITTNTAWQTRTFRAGAKRLLLSGEWAAIWTHDPEARYTGLGVRPGSYVWPGDAQVHYITFHLVRVAEPRFEGYNGGEHYGLTP